MRHCLPRGSIAAPSLRRACVACCRAARRRRRRSPPVPPPPAPPPPPRRRRRARVHAGRVDRAARLAATTAADRRGPRSLVGCRALARRRRARKPSGSAVRRSATRRRHATRRACARSSRRILAHTAVAAADGSDAGLVTGYYEPLLAGSRTRDARYRRAAVRPPDDLLDRRPRRRSIPSSRTSACAAASRAAASCRTGRAPRSSAAARRSPARRSPTSPIRSTPSSCRSRARAASRSTTAASMRVGYADQNGHPYRSIGARADRPRRAHARARVDAGDQAWGRAHPDKLPRAARRESELRVLPRSAAAARRARSRPRSTGRSARSACRCSRERTIAVDPRFVPLGAPVFSRRR